MCSLVTVIDRKKPSLEELRNFSQDELIDHVLRIQAHNDQLQGQLKSALKTSTTTDTSCVSEEKKRPFNFSKCNKRHVLLKFLYLGWDYDGLASQMHTIQTIEHHFFAALLKCCLIEDRQNSNYHRCGRTDKGVSAFSQTISLDLRSKLSQEKIDLAVTEGELPYVKMLNRLLPQDIRVLSWRPVPSTFSARFDCKSRTYKYFFPRGSLDIVAMNEAAKHIVGCHDFRNLCKMSVKNGVVNYIRQISCASVSVQFLDPKGKSEYDVCELILTGKAFLWHQVRCIMSVLLLVGQHRESPSVMCDLLNVEKNPCKPQYSPAVDLPLNLFECEYENKSTILEPEVWDMDALEMVVQNLQSSWGQFIVRSVMIRNMLHILEKDKNTLSRSQGDWLQAGVQQRQYRPLLKRPTCESLEDRIDYYSKKKFIKIEEQPLESKE